MVAGKRTNFLGFLAFACGVVAPGSVLAQRPMGTPDYGAVRAIEEVGSLDVYLKGPNGEALARAAVVTLIKVNGQFLKEGVAKGGHVHIDDVPPTEYNMRVVAAGYATITKKVEIRNSADVKVTVQLEATAEGIDAISDREMAVLGPKAQKALGKAIEALRANKPADARGPLEKASQIAPQSAEVQYLFGVMRMQVGNAAQAASYWEKTLELDPRHYRALISLSETLLHENRAAEAMPYLERAVRAEPTAWRPHALYAEAYLKQGWPVETVREAERAQELGHAKATAVQPVLAAALFKQGQAERATTILQGYVKEHPADAQAKNELAEFQSGAKEGGVADSATVSGGIVDVLPSSWLPADIDEKMGSVEPGTACALNDILKKTADRIQEFLENVNRFTATESLQHESINKWGIADSPVNRRFDYLVAVEEVKAGYFNVDEYRTNVGGGNEFPDGIATNGLPAMILILHPHNVVNFDITCEGLAKWNDRPAWQIHFRQRPDRPNTIRTYRMGLQGRAYPVGLKGRAWIAADTFQVVRMETQMIAPVREINLVADYTTIEYGPVHFNKRDLDMWLPQTAEVYSDWRGRRFHRTHRFSHYMLFSVDEKQNISAPKTAAEAAPKTDGETERPNP
jgi:tetratricopeptide (TPR) repeat protein